MITKRLPSPLYAICDAEVCDRAGWTLVDFAAACIDGGATFLQVRAKGVSSAWLLDATTAIVRRAQASGALVVVNDRADLARLAGAGGVHVGQTDLSPAAVRVVVGPEMLIGRSTHTPEQYEAAFSEPVDYVAIGPVFATATKATGCDAVGLEGVRGAVARTAAARCPAGRHRRHHPGPRAIGARPARNRLPSSPICSRRAIRPDGFGTRIPADAAPDI
jgi:thiamine-phosphate pyrophosphorylase